jgi:dihydrofolate synthase/folylpolyglutamate synthase
VLKEILGIADRIIIDGIKNTVWPGRFEVIGEQPLFIIDGAHNEDAALQLSASVEKYFTNRRVIYIIGVLKDKEYEKMVEILAPTMAAAVVITPDTPRGLPKEILAPLIQAQGVPVLLADTSAEALQKAREQAGETGVILVSGSLSFLAEYLQLESGDENNGASR